MKKVFALIAALALTLCASVAAAPGIDLSGMSMSELLDLREQVDAALWASDEWQTVTVPIGVYQIGKDIPAGRWTISPVEGRWSMVCTAYDMAANGVDVGIHGYAYSAITSESNQNYKNGDATSVTWDLTSGFYIQIKDSAVIFTRPVGLPFTFD